MNLLDHYVHGLAPFQEEGVAFLTNARVRFLLDQQGLGKTPQAIRAAGLVGARRITVVCPAIGRIMWRRAFDAWGVEPHLVQVFSYDAISQQAPASTACDVLILDEAHYLKNQTTKRAIAVYGESAQGRNCVAEYAEVIWCLSGTLIPNGPHELYSHLRALLPETITVAGAPLYEWEWLDRYFHHYTDPVRQRVVVRGPKQERIEELRALIRPHVLRRTKAQVLPQLPPLRTEVMVLPAHEPKYSAAEQLALSAALSAMATDSADSPDITPLATARRITGEAKVPLALDYIRELLEAEPKVIVFAYHTEVIKRLLAGLAKYRPVVIQGGQLDKARQAAIDSFQTDPTVRVVVGQITACNMVIDLTAASREVFVEYSFVPGENAQAAERAHRFTTTQPVLATFLALQGSLDEAITRVNERKTAAIAALWREAA